MISLKLIEKVVIDNSPVILTGVGVVGVVATAVLTHKAATRSASVYIVASEESPEPVMRKDLIKLTWKHYVPPVTVGAATIGSIVLANRIGAKRTAAIAAAFAISEKHVAEYKNKVVEKFGEKKEQEVNDDLAKEFIEKSPPSPQQMATVISSGDIWCCDLWSGRYFPCNMDKINKAVNEVNQEIIKDGYASLTDFWQKVGLPRTQESDEVGWNQDKLLEVDFTTVLTKEGTPCLAYRFPVHPIRGHFWTHA